MAEVVTFENFNPQKTESVYQIGDGVVPEIAEVFDFKLTTRPNAKNLGDLIGVVGPAKELQNNIQTTQQRLGTDGDAIEIARGWVERSGLLKPVYRSFANPELGVPDHFDVAVITGGVRNWMVRRAEKLIALPEEVDSVLLVAGSRKMNTKEGEDVEEGMTEADYMSSVIGGVLKASGIDAELVRVQSSSGDDVMQAASQNIDPEQYILSVTNAGNWVQNAGQLRRAMTKHSREYDQYADQLFVVSDSFPLGNGTEPTASHQNPLSAVGMILRNAQEFVRSQA